MEHTMTVKVYRKRPGAEPAPVTSKTIRIDPEAVSQGELEAQLLPTAWGPCRCPRHRAAVDR
ncbi:hypothetical protein [Streptomyces buecherae]|uniref:Uncharacterized protein n=1 Tax=Streptomyces buecherae TaxID=2763006 RepID=A0A7H8N8N1_9ACTN|nr:hypothetical protein [Streptomyces buecherae]QKW50716.1 hypothetical protein HUT08_15560 [Streptomyces buecherae]